MTDAMFTHVADALNYFTFYNAEKKYTLISLDTRYASGLK